MECPNSCGADNLQHQHLEEHVSSQCPLTYVECEFSDAGCDAKVYRKDLASHLTDNLVTHMSLLAMENRKLKQQLLKQEEKADVENRKLQQQLAKQEERAVLENRKVQQQLKKQEEKASIQAGELKLQLQKQEERMESVLESVIGTRDPPIDMLCPAKLIEEGGKWSSEPFFSRIGYRKLQVEFQFSSQKLGGMDCFQFVSNLQDKQFHDLQVTVILMNHLDGSKNVTFTRKEDRHNYTLRYATERFVRNSYLHFCITDIKCL